jgi:hypothetical protein
LLPVSFEVGCSLRISTIWTQATFILFFSTALALFRLFRLDCGCPLFSKHFSFSHDFSAGSAGDKWHSSYKHSREGYSQLLTTNIVPPITEPSSYKFSRLTRILHRTLFHWISIIEKKSDTRHTALISHCVFIPVTSRSPVLLSIRRDIQIMSSSSDLKQTLFHISWEVIRDFTFHTSAHLLRTSLSEYLNYWLTSRRIWRCAPLKYWD